MQAMGWLAISFCSGLVLGSAATHAQVRKDPPACWLDYADCARLSSGDEAWRSICYADFTDCVGQNPLPSCPGQGHPRLCTDYVAECNKLFKDNDVLKAQCVDDKDACEFAHGC